MKCPLAHTYGAGFDTIVKIFRFARFSADKAGNSSTLQAYCLVTWQIPGSRGTGKIDFLVNPVVEERG